MNPLEEEIKQYEKQISDINTCISELRHRISKQCPHCYKDIDIQNTVLIHDMYYVRPRGCMGGDYWLFNAYYFRCNECNNVIHVYSKTKEVDTVNMRNFIYDNMHKFKERLDNYDDVSHNMLRFHYDEAESILRAKKKERENRKNNFDW